MQLQWRWLFCQLNRSERGSNSKILKYQEVQNFAKGDTENAELADAQTAAFYCVRRKNLYILILGRIFSGEPDSDDNHRRASALELFLIPRTELYTG